MQFDFDILTAAIFAALGILIVLKKRASGQDWGRLIMFALFYTYTVMVASQTLFPVTFSADMRRIFGQNVWSHVRLMPFADLGTANIREFILNIILLAPFGFLLQFVGTNRKSFRRTLVAGCGLSLLIELSQFALAFVQGFTFRFMSANDVIANTLGCAAGFGMFVLFKRAFTFCRQKEWFEMNSLLRFVEERTK